jgi:hypothetical protein
MEERDYWGALPYKYTHWQDKTERRLRQGKDPFTTRGSDTEHIISYQSPLPDVLALAVKANVT